MTAPLILAFMLIQAPSSAPQEFQAQPTTRFEPVLATGIKVEVVEAPGVEAETYAAAATPVSTTSFVGVVPRMSPCRWAAAWFGGRQSGTDACSNLFRWSETGAFLTGSSYAEWAAWRVRVVEDEAAASRAARGRAIQQANAAKKAQSGSAQGGASSGRSSYASGSNAGGGGSSGRTWTGTSSGASTTGSAKSKGRME